MKVIRQASDVADVADLVIREFLAKRINHMVTDWAPDLWSDFGQLLVLESGDDPAIVETAERPSACRLADCPGGSDKGR